MKKLTGFSIGGVVIGVLILALLGVATYSIIDGNNKATDFSKYDFYSVIEGNSDNGGIGDHVKGNADAPVLIYEYADYQCSGCASVNPKVNQIIKDLDGKLGIVYRSFILKYHTGKNMLINFLMNRQSGLVLLLPSVQHFLINILRKLPLGKVILTNLTKI